MLCGPPMPSGGHLRWERSHSYGHLQRILFWESRGGGRRATTTTRGRGRGRVAALRTSLPPFPRLASYAAGKASLVSLAPISATAAATSQNNAESLLDVKSHPEGIIRHSARPHKVSKLALKRCKDWRRRVARLAEALCQLSKEKSAAELLNTWEEQLTPRDMCIVIKTVGNSNWMRALEVYEWLSMGGNNHRKVDLHMLCSILGVLGRANQLPLAEEIYMRAEPLVEDCVQVYNSMMSVYARRGLWGKVEHLLHVMASKGCNPDLYTFNIMINARCKEGLQPGMATNLVKKMLAAGVIPDVVTYNTVISACRTENKLAEAVELFRMMETHHIEPDMWTFNSMISVFGRAGAHESARELFRRLKILGFKPDAVTYNAMLYAYVKSGQMDEVEAIRYEMGITGCKPDEITFNTLISMYGKLGSLEISLHLYYEMKSNGCYPDAVTFTVLIDALGKAGQIIEAEKLFSEMGESGVRPTLQTFSAMIHAYEKADMSSQAEITFDCMLRTGISPDTLVYCMMLRIYQKADTPTKAVALYRKMASIGFEPDIDTCGALIQLFINKKETCKELGDITLYLHRSMTRFSFQEVFTTFLKNGLYEKAGSLLIEEAGKGRYHYNTLPNKQAILSLVNAYCSEGRYAEARSFVHVFDDIMLEMDDATILQDLIVILLKAKQVDAAKEEIEAFRKSGQKMDLEMFQALLKALLQAEMFSEVLSLFSDTQSGSGHNDDLSCIEATAMAHCKLGAVESAHALLKSMQFWPNMDLSKACSVYSIVLEGYARQKLWKKAEAIFKEMQSLGIRGSLRAWNALLLAYAGCGQYENARLALHEMVKAGLTPSASSCSSLLEAFIIAGWPHHLNELLEELRQLAGLNPFKDVFQLLLSICSKNSKHRDLKQVYRCLTSMGYSPTFEDYKGLVSLLSKQRLVEDFDFVVNAMESNGLAPNTAMWNTIVKFYVKVGQYRKAVESFNTMQEAGFLPDSATYNNLIRMYGKHSKIEESLALIKHMQEAGCSPDNESYTALILTCAKLQLVEFAETLYRDMQENGCLPNRFTFHSMMKVYKGVGSLDRVKVVLEDMKTAGIEPNLETFQLLIEAHGKCSEPKAAEMVLLEMMEDGLTPGSIQFTGVINAYLRSKEYDLAIEKLSEMRDMGFEPDYKTWTCVVGAASICETSHQALTLLSALSSVGFSLPSRLLTGKRDELFIELENLLEGLQTHGEGVGLGLVNVLIDLLWGFQRHATAARVFNIAMDRGIYHQSIARVETSDWGADFRTLSAGPTLLALTLWFDRMQDASLQGFPVCSSSVEIVTGENKNGNSISLYQTLKVHLWSMGTPFRTSKTKSGVFTAKGYSLQRWLKDSPRCADLELRDLPLLPENNVMCIHGGAFMQRKLVPGLQEIQATMGEVHPKKFYRLVHLPPATLSDVIAADLQGKREMIEKGKYRFKNPRRKIQKKRLIIL